MPGTLRPSLPLLPLPVATVGALYRTSTVTHWRCSRCCVGMKDRIVGSRRRLWCPLVRPPFFQFYQPAAFDVPGRRSMCRCRVFVGTSRGAGGEGRRKEGGRDACLAWHRHRRSRAGARHGCWLRAKPVLDAPSCVALCSMCPAFMGAALLCCCCVVLDWTAVASPKPPKSCNDAQAMTVAGQGSTCLLCGRGRGKNRSPAEKEQAHPHHIHGKCKTERECEWRAQSVRQAGAHRTSTFHMAATTTRPVLWRQVVLSLAGAEAQSWRGMASGVPDDLE